MTLGDHISRNEGSSTLVAFIEVILCSGFPSQFVLAVGLSIIGLAAQDETGQLSIAYVAILSLADTTILVGLIFYFLNTHGEIPRQVFLGTRPHRRELILGCLLVPVMVITAVAGLTTIRYFWPSLHNIPENPMETLIQSPTDALIFAVVAIVAGGVREELQRAFILSRFEQHLGGGWLGLIVFSLAFGLGHQIQGWDAAIVTAVLGAAWGIIYLVRRSIVPNIISHAGFNLAEIILVLTTAGPT